MGKKLQQTHHQRYMDGKDICGKMLNILSWGKYEFKGGDTCVHLCTPAQNPEC